MDAGILKNISVYDTIITRLTKFERPKLYLERYDK